MKNSIFVFLFMLSKLTFSQSDTIFFNKDWDKCAQRSEASFYRVVEKKDDQFLIKDMYLESNTPQMVAFSKNAVDPLIKEGKCTYYNASGIKEEEGNYKANKKIGIWTNWYDGGKDSSVTNYRENADPEYIRISNKQSVSPDGELYTIVESMPVFPGGNEAMSDFIKANIKYPKKEKKNGISGVCYITFTVDTDGSIKDPWIRRGIPNGEGCDEEALRVIRMMPKWKPGTQNGKRVKVQYNIPIRFNL